MHKQIQIKIVSVLQSPKLKIHSDKCGKMRAICICVFRTSSNGAFDYTGTKHAAICHHNEPES